MGLTKSSGFVKYQQTAIQHKIRTKQLPITKQWYDKRHVIQKLLNRLFSTLERCLNDICFLKPDLSCFVYVVYACFRTTRRQCLAVKQKETA